MSSLSPRLMDRGSAAAYLGVSPDTIDRLRHAGTLPTVKLPGSRNRRTNGSSDNTCRRILIDREDCDHLISAWKESE